jgi:hypothetical protein
MFGFCIGVTKISAHMVYYTPKKRAGPLLHEPALKREALAA